MWKIVRVDNYDRETRAERLVAENFANLEEAIICQNALCVDPNRNDDDWFRVREQDNPLWRGMEELV